MGKNSIDTIMKKMKENSPPQKDLCPEKKITWQTTAQEDHSQEAEKFWTAKVRNKE